MAMTLSDFLSSHFVDHERVEEHKARMLREIAEHESSASTQDES